MPDPNLPDTLGTILQSIQRRLHKLETVPPYNTSYDQSFVQFRDARNTIRVKIGLQGDGYYGIRVWDLNENLIFDQTAPPP